MSAAAAILRTARTEVNNGSTKTHSWNIRRRADVAAQRFIDDGRPGRAQPRSRNQRLAERDDDLCTHAIADDEEIDQLEKQIDKDGFEILLRYQPVASDLRRVISAIKLSPNIERIGDQATNIAKRARKLNRHPPLPEVQMIVPIQAYATTMFKDSINAYVRENVELARSVCDRDEQLDDMNRDANRKLTQRMMEDREQLRGYFNLILVSRALERVGDHATNISEDAVYAAAAEDIRHQSLATSV